MNENKRPKNKISSHESLAQQSIETSKGKYKMNHNTLWFIANGMAKQTRPLEPKLYNLRAIPRPCYDCGGDHWVKNCPNPRRELELEPGLSP